MRYFNNQLEQYSIPLKRFDPPKPINFMKFTISVVFIFIMKTVSAQDASLYFNFDSHILRSNDVMKLQELIRSYKNSNFKFKLQGYADSSGTGNYNMDLSRK